jgi:hypothetical protein
MKHKSKNNPLSEHAQYPIDKAKQKQKKYQDFILIELPRRTLGGLKSKKQKFL